MRFGFNSIVTGLLAAASIALTMKTAMADGFKPAVIAEYSSQLPNLEMVRYVKVVFQPGGKLDNIEIVHEEYCRLSQGQLTHINHTTKITDVFTVGSLWSPPKGHRHTVTNTGEGLAIMWVYQLVKKGAKKERNVASDRQAFWAIWCDKPRSNLLPTYIHRMPII